MRTTPSKNKLLTVELKPVELRKFRSYARRMETSMTALVRSYVRSTIAETNKISLGDK